MNRRLSVIVEVRTRDDRASCCAESCRHFVQSKNEGLGDHPYNYNCRLTGEKIRETADGWNIRINCCVEGILVNDSNS